MTSFNPDSLKGNTRRMLDISTAHISQETCDAATAKAITWANTGPTEFGFIVYVHDERDDETFNDLWDVIEFARAWGFEYVMFDRDAPHLPEGSGLPVFDW
jgi:hypothetical protein